MSTKEQHEVELVEQAFEIGESPFDEALDELKVEQHGHLVSALESLKAWHRD